MIDDVETGGEVRAERTQRPAANTQAAAHRAAWGAVVLSILLPVAGAQGEERGIAAAAREMINRAAGAPSTREDAIDRIPFAKLSDSERAKVNHVLANTTLYRRLPAQVVDCDPDLYLYLVDHPDVLVNIWEVMGVSNVALGRVGPGVFQADDGAGTRGTIEYLHRDFDLHVMYAEGTYQGPVFQRPVRGRAVIVLESGYVRETDGRYYITNRIDAFVELEHLGVEVVAKTFQPLVGKVADDNFREATAYVASLSRSAELNPDGVRRLTDRLTKIPPEVRQGFAARCNDIAARAGRPAASQDNIPVSAVRRDQATPQPSGAYRR